MQQPLTVADQLNIRQLLARYPRFLDNRDVDHRAGTGEPPRLRHVVGEPVIETSTTGCTAHSYCVIFRVANDGASVASVGEYTDHCLKLNGHWVFAKRRMVFRPFLG